MGKEEMEGLTLAEREWLEIETARIEKAQERLNRLRELGCHEIGISDPYIFGREEEVVLIEKTLIQLKKPNVILVGGAGTGKTAVVEKLAHNIRNNRCSDILKGHIVVELTTNQMVSGTQYRGQFEEKIEKLIQALKGEKIILFIDEIHTVMGLGDAGNNGQKTLGLQDMLKPYLARGEIKVIGATTNDEYEMIMTDPAFERRFRAVHVVEPTLPQTITVLQNSLTPYTRHYGITIHEKFIKQIVDASQKIKGFNPDKSLTIMELALSNAKYENKTAIDAEDVKYGIINY